jgi:hypothetical protein
MKRIVTVVCAVAAVGMLMASCVTPAPQPQPSPQPVVQQSGPFDDLYGQMLMMRKQGIVCDVGIGSDNLGRFDLALEKAMVDGQSKVAGQFEIKVEALKKKFVEEVGSAANNTELNETFQSVTKTVIQKTLNGAQSLSAPKSFKEGKTTQVGIIVGIDPKQVNSSFIDELKGKNVNLYERFRSTQAFEDLKKEMDNYNAGK